MYAIASVWVCVQMRFWIEVIRGEWNWDNSLAGKRCLNAPNKSRYLKFFEGIRVGDLALHYLASWDTLTKNKKSSVVGISKIDSEVAEEGFKIIAKIKDVKELERPVSFSELKQIDGKSQNLEKLVKTSMQLYLTEITRQDFEKILKIHQENESMISEFIF